jgi:flagellar capping protein FliD
MINSRETTATSKLSDHEEALTKLEERMDVVYNRYLQQFGAMETLMVTLDSTRDYLTSQFETLSKAYEVD